MTNSRRESIRRSVLLVALAPCFASCGTLFDPDSYPHAPVGPSAPAIAGPRYAAFLRGQADSVAFRAQDANGDAIDSVASDLAALPPGNDATLTSAPVSGSEALQCTLRWTAQTADTGIYPVIFTAMNDLTGPPDTIWIYTIDHPADVVPAVSCPDSLHLLAGVPRTFSVSADDPDGDPVFLFEPTAPLGGSTLQPLNLLSWDPTVSGSHADGTLTLRANRPGTFSVTFTAINAGNGFGTTTLYVSEP